MSGDAAEQAAGESQQELDRRLNVTAADREALRAGRMPAALQRGGRSLGGLSVFAALLGAGAGAFFGWNTGLAFSAKLGIGLGTFAAVCAGLGGVIAVVLLRRSFGGVVGSVGRLLQAGKVRHEVLVLRAEPDEGGRARLVAEDGRTFQVPLRFGAAPLAGRFEAWYVEVGETTTSEASPFKEPRLMLALEIAG